jgi:thioredoxin reductase (NADPH)
VQEFEAVDGHYRLNIDGESIETQSVIIASGASEKWLGLDQEWKLKGHGVTSCATCDGAFYRNVPVCVIGGGDTATEEAIFLTRFASEVFLVHRRDTLRATKIMAERALNHRKIRPIWKTEVSNYLADKKGEIEGVELKNVETGERSTLDVKCVFVAIGHTPNTDPFKGKVEMDPNGYLLQKKGTQTNLPGVFAAGDVADPIYRQAVTAAGQGCAAAIEAERYLTDLE